MNLKFFRFFFIYLCKFYFDVFIIKLATYNYKISSTIILLCYTCSKRRTKRTPFVPLFLSTLLRAYITESLTEMLRYGGSMCLHDTILA